MAREVRLTNRGSPWITQWASGNNDYETIRDAGGNPAQLKYSQRDVEGERFRSRGIWNTRGMVGLYLMRLLQKLADNKLVDSTTRDDEPEVTIMRRKEVGSDDKNLIEGWRPRERRCVTDTCRGYFAGITQAGGATEQKNCHSKRKLKNSN